MTKPTNAKPAKKKHHALRKLIGAVAIAGATYAAEKIMESRKNKKESNKKNKSV